jgi:hypothetical protein
MLVCLVVRGHLGLHVAFDRDRNPWQHRLEVALVSQQLPHKLPNRAALEKKRKKKNR